jgi:hypothetical protein
MKKPIQRKSASNKPDHTTPERFARHRSNHKQRDRGAQSERCHRQSHAREIFRLRGQHRSRAQRRSYAGTPHCTQQDADPELTPKPACGQASSPFLRPVSDRPGGGCQPLLHAREQQCDADDDHEHCSGVAEQVLVKSCRKPDGCDEKADRNKRQRKPPASAKGPRRCSPIAAPTTIGTRGSTHGDRVESSPAISASPALPTCDQIDLSSNCSIEPAFVSPVERPASSLPLNTIKVLCIRTLNFFSRSF